MRRFGVAREQALEVVRRAVEVRLEHRADAVVAGVAEALVDPQRHVDVLRLLHVDAEERAELAGARDESLDVRVRDLLVEGEAEVRELERDVRLQLLRDEALDDLLVLGGDGGRALGVRDRLAEERRVRVQARVVELAQHGDALVERLAGDEASGADAPAVALHETLEASALGRVQDRGPRRASRLLSGRRSSGAEPTSVQCQFRLGSGGIAARSAERAALAPEHVAPERRPGRP